MTILKFTGQNYHPQYVRADSVDAVTDNSKGGGSGTLLYVKGEVIWVDEKMEKVLQMLGWDE